MLEAWARALTTRACSQESGDSEDRGTQGHIGYHLGQVSKWTKIAAWWDPEMAELLRRRELGGPVEGGAARGCASQVLRPVWANQRFCKEKC